jgi:hypothetical protein
MAAELNDLLRQGTAEAETLASEAARAQQTVDRLLKMSAALAAAVEAGSTEAHRRLDVLGARVLAAEQELAHENAGAVAALQGLQASAGQVRSQAGGFLDKVRADLAQLRQAKEQARGELEHEDEAAKAQVLRYGTRVRALEAEAEQHLAEAHRVNDVLREQVEAVRATVVERRQALLAELHALEYGIRHRLEDVMRSYEEVASVVEDQIAELQATSRSLSDQVAAGLSRRFEADALASLEAATRPVRDAIDGLEELVQEGKTATASRIGEIAGRIEDVTGSLERLRSPLETVKQHLR